MKLPEQLPVQRLGRQQFRFEIDPPDVEYDGNGRGRLPDFTAKGLAGPALRRILAAELTVFGQMVLLSRLRNISGIYSHPVLEDSLGTGECDRALSHCHHQVFNQWIGFTLAEQKADLEAYLRSSHQTVSLEFCRGLVPPSAHEVERLLYLTDLETLLELLRLERGGAFGRPEA